MPEPFHGKNTRLLAFRELDDALGLTEMAGQVLTDRRTGKANLADLYDYLEAESYKYIQRFYASFSYPAKSWSRKRCVVALDEL